MMNWMIKKANKNCQGACKAIFYSVQENWKLGQRYVVRLKGNLPDDFFSNSKYIESNCELLDDDRVAMWITIPGEDNLVDVEYSLQTEKLSKLAVLGKTQFEKQEAQMLLYLTEVAQKKNCESVIRIDTLNPEEIHDICLSKHSGGQLGNSTSNRYYLVASADLYKAISELREETNRSWKSFIEEDMRIYVNPNLNCNGIIVNQDEIVLNIGNYSIIITILDIDNESKSPNGLSIGFNESNLFYIVYGMYYARLI